MILIFGGAYQGKLGYARDNFKIETVFDCSKGQDQGAEPNAADLPEPNAADLPEPDASDLPEPDLSADAISGIEAFVAACTERGIEAADWFSQRRDQWQDRVLIIQDQSQGVVPIDARQRAAREMNGRLMIYLAGQAEEVHRVFCGIGQRIK